MPDPADLPVVERITQNLLDTLAGITTAKGFRTTLSAVSRPNRLGVSPETGASIITDNSAILEEIDAAATLEGDGVPAMAIEWSQRYALTLFVFESESSRYEPRRRLIVLLSEVIVALMRDYQRHGLAVDTRMESAALVDNADDSGALDAIQLMFVCPYRTDVSDPYVSRG